MNFYIKEGGVIFASKHTFPQLTEVSQDQLESAGFGFVAMDGKNEKSWNSLNSKSVQFQPGDVILHRDTAAARKLNID